MTAVCLNWLCHGSGHDLQYCHHGRPGSISTQVHVGFVVETVELG